MGPFTSASLQWGQQSRRSWLRSTLFPAKRSSVEFDEGKDVSRCADDAGTACTSAYAAEVSRRTFHFQNISTHIMRLMKRTSSPGMNLLTCTWTACTFCYQLLVLSGTPLHRNVSAAGSWEKGVWSMELRSRWPRRSAKLFDYTLLCFLMKLNYWKRTTALPWSYSQ